MRLRTFTAPDMPSAMKMARDALGENAIIISSQPASGRQGISVTAAIDDREDIPSFLSAQKPKPEPARAPDRENDLAGQQLRYDMQNVLRFHNLPELFVAKMLQKISNAELAALIALQAISGRREPRYLQQLAMEAIASNYFSFQPLAPEGNDARIMLIGTPGIGKTLTIARIAARLAMDKLPPLVITTDNKRAGGIEQLQAFTDILGLQLKIATNPDELWHHLADLAPDERALIDTAGCNPYDMSELKELTGYAMLGGIEPVLVLPAGGDSLETIDMVEAMADLPIKRLLVTKADTARRFGGILAAAAAHNLAFCNVSSSSGIIDALQPMDSQLLAQLLLRYQNRDQNQNQYQLQSTST